MKDIDGPRQENNISYYEMLFIVGNVGKDVALTSIENEPQ